MFLAVDEQLTLEALRGAFEFALRVASTHALRVGVKALGSDRTRDRSQRRERLVNDAHLLRCEAREFERFTDDPGHWLAAKANLLGKERFIVAHGANVIFTGNVVRPETAEHAGHGQCRAEVDLADI